MYLLYADESGSVSDPKQNFFVLAGVCLFEKQGYWISNQMDAIAARFNPADPAGVELHGSPMFHGKKFWRQFSIADRIQAIKDCLSLISLNPGIKIFACIIKKSITFLRDPVEMAFEQFASRFDHYLKRLHKLGNSQRGIIIFDKSTYETTIQSLTTDFRKIGYTWNVLRNFAEVPLFLNSKASRLIQLADLVAYAFFRYYEQNDPQFFTIISESIDSDGNQKHGLCERTR
jgi:hypothetical protein